MEEINSLAQLRATIILLEKKQDEQGSMLKAQFHETYESLKPINIIKNELRQTGLWKLDDQSGKSIIGIAISLITKLAFELISNAPLKNIISKTLMYGATNLIEKNPDSLINLIKTAWKIIKKKTHSKHNENVHQDPDEHFEEEE